MNWPELYSHLMACFPGLGWEYFADHFDLPRLDALTAYQRQHPPLHIIAASLAGIRSGGSQQPIESAAEFVPVATCSKTEFDNVLAGFGLPTG